MRLRLATVFVRGLRAERFGLRVRCQSTSLCDVSVSPPPETKPRRRLLVVGAGPAGLTAGFDAIRAGWGVVVLEKDPVYVGGISRTVQHDGYRFDIGGHRFFSKSAEVTRWWKERLPDDFIQVRRMSRIFYRRRYFDYPLKPWNALSNLGLLHERGLRAELRLGPALPEQARRNPSRTGSSNRFGRTPLQHLLQDLHREGLGNPDERAERGLGRPEDQGAFALRRPC